MSDPSISVFRAVSNLLAALFGLYLGVTMTGRAALFYAALCALGAIANVMLGTRWYAGDSRLWEPALAHPARWLLLVGTAMLAVAAFRVVLSYIL